MARLRSVTVALDRHGHHDLDAMAEAAAEAARRRAVPTAQSDRHDRVRSTTSSGSCAGCRRTPSCCSTRPTSSSCPPSTGIDAPALVERYPNVVVLRTFSKAYGLAGLRIGYGFCAPDLARRLWTMQLPFGIGSTGLVGVAASYDAEAELQQRIRVICAEGRLPAGPAARDGRLQHRRATRTSSTCPRRATPLARGVRRFRAAGAHLRRRRRADQHRQPAVVASGARGGGAAVRQSA